MKEKKENVPIRIISPGFDLLGEIKDYESLQFTRRFYKVGEFELHINIHKRHTDVLVKNNLIILNMQENKVGIIRHRESEVDENGEPTDTLIIKGPTLKGVCSQRLVVPDTNETTGYDSYSGTQETIMKHFVDHHIVNPVDANRKIAQVSIAADGQRGIQDKWRFRFDVLSDALDTIGEYAKLGWDVTLDLVNKQWVFDVYSGRNLTTSQNINPPVFFSDKYGTIKVPHLIQSWLNAATVGYCGGQGDGANRMIQEVGSAAGFDRMETFLDCSDAADAAELVSMGNQKLTEAGPVNTFTFSLTDPNKPFIYGVDYDLGDTVTAILEKWGVQLDTQITEVKEVYESGNSSVDFTFGNTLPNFVSYIRQKTKERVR